jgi:DNA-binding NarL/FixJ family response regulator
MNIRLRPRERQVAKLLIQGYDNLEISKALHIAQRTVKSHFNRMFATFRIENGIKRVKLATILYENRHALGLTHANTSECDTAYRC